MPGCFADAEAVEGEEVPAPGGATAEDLGAELGGFLGIAFVVDVAGQNEAAAVERLEDGGMVVGRLFGLGETVKELGQARRKCFARDALGVLQDLMVAFLWED